ncbi:hypothetical protein LTR66_017500, partial [Elasticomyces elasticus]
MENSYVLEDLRNLEPDLLEAVIGIFRNDISSQRVEQNDKSDFLTVYEFYLDEAEAHLNLEKDRRFAESITAARLNDQTAIEAATDEERHAREDHEFACRL